MALTETQKAQLREHLGYPARFHQVDPSFHFEQALEALDGTPEDEARVVALLDELVNPTTGIDVLLRGTYNRLKAAKVGPIVLQAQTEIGSLRSEGRRIVKRIAMIMGVDIAGDAYSGSPVMDNRF